MNGCTRGSIALVATFLIATAALGSNLRPQLDLRYYALSESNIYHSYEDTLEVASMLNVLETEAYWSRRVTRKFEHRFSVYADFDLYPNYSNRNKSSIGINYLPEWRYTKKGRLGADIDISRRNKDLIDDSGQSLTRTLKRWDSQIELMHRYDFDQIRTEVYFRYFDANYDETDTLAINGVDTAVVSLMSYDYHFSSWRLRLYYEPVRDLQARGTVTTESRDYDERRTYSVQYGAIKGRPFQIRSFRENTLEGRLAYRFTPRVRLIWETEYSRRKDNFENFYGYKQWQHKIIADVKWSSKHNTSVYFRFKTKNYDNYFTKRIAAGDQVSIDYSDFQLEQEYRLTRVVMIRGYIRNYNKVSNDYAFDYHDFTGGIGFSYEI